MTGSTPLDGPPAPVDPVRVRLRRLLLDGPGGYMGAARKLGCRRDELYAVVEGHAPGADLVEKFRTEYGIESGEWVSVEGVVE